MLKIRKAHDFHCWNKKSQKIYMKISEQLANDVLFVV